MVGSECELRSPFAQLVTVSAEVIGTGLGWLVKGKGTWRLHTGYNW